MGGSSLRLPEGGYLVKFPLSFDTIIRPTRQSTQKMGQRASKSVIPGIAKKPVPSPTKVVRPVDATAPGKEADALILAHLSSFQSAIRDGPFPTVTESQKNTGLQSVLAGRSRTERQRLEGDGPLLDTPHLLCLLDTAPMDNSLKQVSASDLTLLRAFYGRPVTRADASLSQSDAPLPVQPVSWGSSASG